MALALNLDAEKKVDNGHWKFIYFFTLWKKHFWLGMMQFGQLLMVSLNSFKDINILFLKKSLNIKNGSNFF